MSDTKEYGNKHLPHHLFEARLWVELLQVAELRGEQNAALRETIARLEREKGLLVAVAEAAREYQVAVGTRWGGDSDMAHLLKLGIEFNDARQAAIDGGALGSGDDE